MRRQLHWFALLLAGVTCPAQQSPGSAADLILDGKLDDPFWQNVPAQRLLPAEPGVPGELGGEVRLAVRGGYLCLSARLPEPGGKVFARSIGRNPIWEQDALESPPVEDRMVYSVRYRNPAGAERDLAIAINPWGAYRIEQGGQVAPDTKILRAANVTPEGWALEAAIPVYALDVESGQSGRTLELRTERIRSRRALAPEFRWSWPATGHHRMALPETTDSASKAPEVRSPAIGNTDRALEIGRVLRVPPAVAKWDAYDWKAIPEFQLSRNEPLPRAPRHPTRVKWMHDGRKLALFLHMTEPEPIVARVGTRDGALAGDDHVAIYLATSGSAFVEILVNSAGVIRDAVGSGPRSMRPRYGWDGDLEVQTDIRRGHWLARINIPLDQCAAALGETGVPSEWRILIARHRAPRPGEPSESSTMPMLDGVTTFYGPIRYRAMILGDESPLQVELPNEPHKVGLPEGLAGEISALDPNAWSPLERRYRSVRSMLPRYIQTRAEEAILAERRAWEQVETRADWERFRDERIRGLRESLGQFPPERTPLDVRLAARHRGEGYVLENLVFQSRPGFYVTANLYLPERPSPPIPGILIVHSHHAPKTQFELHDMGEIWARSGCAVLIIERPGFGERAETNTGYRQAVASRFTFSKQLFLAGESYSGWSAWDVIRSVDFLYERPEIDRKRIIVLGAVAGGGEPSAVAAALDPRITTVVPFGYDQGHLRVHGDSPGQIAKQFSPWLVAASVAPRKFVRAFEFFWEGAEEPDFGNLWVDGMSRSEKVWGFYNARESLDSMQGYGLLRFPLDYRSPCHNIGPEHREGLYPILERWFGIPFPSARDRAILPSSQLSSNPDREASRRQEAQRLRPTSDLVSVPPELASKLPRRAMHQIAFDMGRQLLRAARERRQTLGPREQVERLRAELEPLLGDIAPTPQPRATRMWSRSLSAAEVEAMVLEVENGIQAPLLLLRPKGAQSVPVVVAVAHGGKARFLASRSREIESLLHAGVAVCLPEVRGTGETAFSADTGDGDEGPAQREFDLSRSLLGSRLKDLRTVLAYLRERPGIDRNRIALWGESFTPPNPQNLFLDEVEYEAGPQIQRSVDATGPHLALLAGLYEADVRAIAARGGLAGYLSVLENSFTYTPLDVIIGGVLKVGDIPDVAAALAPRPLILGGLVNGRNIRVDDLALKQVFEPADRAYRSAGADGRLTVGTEVQDVSKWLITQTK